MALRVCFGCGQANFGPSERCEVCGALLSLRPPSARDGPDKVERENRRAVGWMAIVGGVVLLLFAALVATSFTCLLVSGSCDLTEPYLLFVAPPGLVGFTLLLWGCGRLA